MSAIGAKRTHNSYVSTAIDHRPAKRTKLNASTTTSSTTPSTTDCMVEYESYLHCISHIITYAIQCPVLRRSFPRVDTLMKYQPTISDALMYNTQTNYEHLKRVIITIHTNVLEYYQSNSNR
eukprot:802800_1